MSGPYTLDPKDEANLYVELWKHTVTVQQHFNDICWRIRGLALTALTFAVGAAALATRERATVALPGRLPDLELSFIIALAGLVLWRSFYYVERRWYHQLLKGSVQHGEQLERALQRYLPEAGLSMAISASSPYQGRVTFRAWPPRQWLTFGRQNVNSTGKLQRFYNIVSILLLAFGLALQLGTSSPESAPAPSLTSTPSATPQPATPTPDDAPPAAPVLPAPPVPSIS